MFFTMFMLALSFAPAGTFEINAQTPAEVEQAFRHLGYRPPAAELRFDAGSGREIVSGNLIFDFSRSREALRASRSPYENC